MSAVGEHFYQYGILCDREGCKASLFRIGVSEQHAFTKVQEDATAAGWEVARDRIYGMGGEGADPEGLAAHWMSRDFCPEHRRGFSEQVYDAACAAIDASRKAWVKSRG